jgi:hypothetical protein
MKLVSIFFEEDSDLGDIKTCGTYRHKGAFS